jgi:ABC-type sugar transport system ATPase subunit
VFAAVARSRQGAALIYVSHRMKEIREIADTATVMRDGRIVSTVDIGAADTREIVRMMLGHDEKKDEMVVPHKTGRTLLSSATSPFGQSSTTSASTCIRARCWALPDCSARAAPSC